MKNLISLCCLLILSSIVRAQIAIPAVTRSVVIPCGTNNYSITGAPGIGGTDIEWFTDYLSTASVGTGTTYNGATATSTMLYVKSKNGAAYSADPSQIFIFKPQAPTATFTMSSLCASGLDITIQVDSIIDSLTTIVSEDATISPANPNTNYNNNFLIVRPQGFCAGNIHFLSKYNLSVLPPGVSPFYSKSSVVAYTGFAHGGNGNVYEQHVVSDAWDETTVTNATSPMPVVPNSTVNASGSWWVWYGFPSQAAAHGSPATMGTSAEGDRPRSNVNVLLNQLVSSEYLGDQTMSLYHFSPGYDSRYYSKDYKTDVNLLPQLQIKFSYNQSTTCTYAWTGPAGFTATTKDLQGLSVNGIYTLVITSQYGCASAPINVNVVTSTNGPTLNNPGNLTNCDSIQLPAITGTNLTAAAGYFSGTNGSGTPYAPNDWITSSMTLYVFDQTGGSPNCTDEETFTVTINSTPILTAPTNLVGCDSIQLPAITGTNLTTAVGYFSGTNGSGTPYAPNDWITSSMTLYAFDQTTTPNCSDEETFTVTINTGPVLAAPNSTTSCAGDAVPASAYTSLPIGATFEWLHTNTAVGLIPVTGSTATGNPNTPGFTATNTTLFPDTTFVSVIPTLNSCPGDTVNYFIAVNPIPAAPTSPDTVICPNSSVTLTASASGGTYDWYDLAIGGTLLSTGPSYTTPVLTVNTSYWVEATISGCTGLKTQVDVTIGAGLVVAATSDVITICPGQTANLSVGPTSPAYSYKWSEPGIAIIDTFPNQAVTPTDTTMYTIVVTDALGCEGIDSILINVKPLPIVTVPADASFCSGAIVPAFNYVVTPTGTAIGTAFWTHSNPSIGTVINGWNNTASFTAVNTTSQPIIDTVSVKPFLGGCEGSLTTHTITINPIPVVFTPQAVVSGEIIYCIGEVTSAINLTGTPSGTLFTWSSPNITTGITPTGANSIPSFVATNITNVQNTSVITIIPTANGCTGNTSIFSIIVSAPITITPFEIKDANCFQSNDGQITLTPTGGTPDFTYSWTTGDTDSIALNLSPGPVTVTVTDINGCFQDSTFYTSEPDSIDYISFYTSDSVGCSPFEVQFNCSIDPALHLLKNYVWNFGNNLVPQDTFIAQSTYVDPGTYDVSLTVTDFSGCTNTLTVNDLITVLEDPEAHFSTFPDNPTMFNPTIAFSDASYPNVVAWEWLFDTLGNSNYENPSFTFPKDSGNYYVTLIVEDDKTCKDTITKKIFIRSEIALFLPNSFTPNGDGLNDTFTPKGFGISEEAYAFLIFNRWGEVVFETNNVLEGWDGTFKGELLTSGVYAWRADFRDLNGKGYRRKGQMNILP